MTGRAGTGIAVLMATLPLLGCGDRSGDYPTLLPTDQVLAEPSIPGHAQIAANSPDQVVADLETAGAALAVSSAEVTANTSVADAALNSRAETLRQRAAALRRAATACADLPDAPGC